MKRIFLWAINEAWEKINIPGIYRELKALGAKHGKRFFWAALIWELIEDVLFPFISWLAGMPELIPLFLILHFEPIAYPIIFFGFRLYDRANGKIPWEPNRSAQSTYWRTLLKTVVYQVSVAGWLVAILLGLNLSPKILIAYLSLMFCFDFVHSRIWHDSNYGIRTDDTVEYKRIGAKTFTYLFISTATLYPMLRVAFGAIPWLVLCACQGIAFIVYLILESVWAHSALGIASTAKE